jgi:lipopolysaccharide export system permease protein
MTKMDRYILSETIMPFISGVLLIVVMLVGNTLYALIQTIAKANIAFPVVAKLVAFNIPTLVPLTLPAATALAAGWTINRLARDSELTPIRMCGVPLRRVFLPIYVLGLVASIFSFLIADRVVPRAQHEYQQTQAQMFAYAIQTTPSLTENQVFTFQDYAFSIKRISKDPSGDINKLNLEGVTIFHNNYATRFPELMTAQTATYNHDIWTLNNVVIHSFGPDGFTASEIAGKSMTLNLRIPLTGLAESAFHRPDELTMGQLGQQMRALKSTGRDYTEVAYNYYAKLALPFVCLAFALCVPPLALRFARAGAYMGIFLSMVMVWVGWNTLLLTKYLGVAGKLNPFVAAWSPDFLFLVVGLWFLWRVE